MIVRSILGIAIIFLIACRSSAGRDRSFAGVRLPIIVGHGTVSVPGRDPDLLISRTGISFKGDFVVALHGDDVDDFEKEGGAAGVKITKLSAAVASTKVLVSGHDNQGTTSVSVEPELVIAADKDAQFRLLVEVLWSAQPVRHFALLASTAHGIQYVPVILDRRVQVTRDADCTYDQLLNGACGTKESTRPVVSLLKGTLILWSLSGREGTLDRPLLMLTAPYDLGSLAKALEGVRSRASASGSSEQRLILMADGDVRVQTIVEVIEAARRNKDDLPLFPELQLTSGYE